jgi:hypothetical protein
VDLPIFLFDDRNGGVSAYHDRQTLDAAVISVEDGFHLTAWSSDGERLALAVAADRWTIAPNVPRVVEIELLRDLLSDRLKFWNEIAPATVSRNRVVERAGAYFKVRRPPTRWQVFAQSVLPFVRFWPS